MAGLLSLIKRGIKKNTTGGKRQTTSTSTKPSFTGHGTGGNNSSTYGKNFKPDPKVLARREAERKRQEAEQARIKRLQEKHGYGGNSGASKTTPGKRQTTQGGTFYDPNKDPNRSNTTTSISPEPSFTGHGAVNVGLGNGLTSSAGWAANDAERANANPMKGTSDAYMRMLEQQRRKADSAAVKDYLGQRSQEFGDIEFVGGLVDALTSNRYYPGEGGNAGMDALAGSNAGLGPDRVGGMDGRVYRNMVNNLGWGSNHRDKLRAEEYAAIDPDYRSFTSAEDLKKFTSGGKYQGATGYNDTKFGLVKLGLFGGGLGDSSGLTGQIIDKFTDKFGPGAGNAEDALFYARMGDPDAIKWVKNNLPSQLEEDFEFYPGGFIQERDDWVGGINAVPGLLKDSERYGYYSPKDNEINIDTDVRAIDQTTNHELMHRGIGALEREYRAYGQDPNNWNWLGNNNPLKGGTTNSFLTIDPDTGKDITMDDFLRDRYMGEADSSSSGDKGHSVEHNMINSVSRNRGKRSNFLGWDDPRDFGDIGKQNRQMYSNVGGVEKLGMLANAIVNANQKDKYNWVKDTRERMDSPRVYGGKSGTKVHPLLAAAGY